MHRKEIVIGTRGRGFTELTRQVAAFVTGAGVSQGMCSVFVPHTSASLLLGENADPSVRRDLEAFMARLVPDGDPLYEHDAEGPDDMSAHIRSVLTQSSIALPVIDGELALGTWQGLYLWEHREAAHERRVILSVW